MCKPPCHHGMVMVTEQTRRPLTRAGCRLTSESETRFETLRISRLAHYKSADQLYINADGLLLFITLLRVLSVGPV